MKTRQFITILVLLFGILFQSQAYQQRDLLQKKADLSEISEYIQVNQQWVPYPSYKDRAGWDKLTGKYKAELIKAGEEQLNYEWKTIPATAYLEYERSGNRNIMQNPNSANNRALSALFMAEMAEGKGRFIDQIINGSFHACEMTSWVLSAHLASYQLSKRALPDYEDQVIDLGSGEMGALLSWIHYFLHNEFDKVTPQVSKRIAYEVDRRILQPYMQTDRFWWMAFNYKPGMMVNNWNPWCNFNVLQCFLLMENEKQELVKAVYRTMVSVDKFINYTHSDGACEEGPSYWGHAAGKMYDYLQLLFDATDGHVSLFKDPIIANMGEYIVRSYVGNGWVVNFADASAKGGGNAPLIYRYGSAVESNLMKQFAAYLVSTQESGEVVKANTSFGTDIFRGLQTLLYASDLEKVEAKLESPRYSWYPDTEFCYMTNSNGFFVATKGGYNNESHNHNDAGTFTLYINTTPMLIDAGVGTYTRQTFSSERYSIWTMQSDYHNLPRVNGISQAFGSEYKATDVKFDPKRMTFSAELATAYPKEADITSWNRSYKLNKRSLEITDRFSLKSSTQPNQINFLTWGTVDISLPGSIFITVNEEKIKLEYNAKLFTPAIETITLDDKRLSTVWGNQIYRLSLNAKEKNKSGSYTYTITTIK